jgi:hypothetical protein
MMQSKPKERYNTRTFFNICQITIMQPFIGSHNIIVSLLDLTQFVEGCYITLKQLYFERRFRDSA